MFSSAAPVRADRRRAQRAPGSALPVSVDPHRWPDVARLPRAGLRTLIARALFRKVVAGLPLQVTEPGRPPAGAGGPGCPVMHLSQPGAFFRRVGAFGLIGLGESYMAGEWDSPDLAGVLTVFASQVSTLVPPVLQRLRRLAVRPVPPGDDPSEEGARHNISRHYDLSNELFALFLDETMSYSCALFEQDGDGRPAAPPPGEAQAARYLAAAQQRKIDRLLDLTGVGPGCRVLEIGTGWGELAIRAARRGATVRTITISQRQRDLAARRVAAAGLGSRVSVELLDYRQVAGQFDVVLSVEMIEAVGARYWPAYFRVLREALGPGGRAGLQAITMPHDRMLATRRTQTWILKYIFPGGLIPSAAAIEERAAAAGLSVADRYDFGPHYAQTLRIWRDRFTGQQAEVARLGFDEVFRRMWTLYLAYAQAGFASGYLGVSQFLLRPASGQPVTAGGRRLRS
jgi:cyclopropane-fatty-acyl-phospholipid synthase